VFEKPGGFFNDLGPPSPLVSVEEPPQFFNNQGLVEESQSCTSQPSSAQLTDESQTGLLPGMPAPAPLARGGRPSVFTPQLKEQLCLLLSVGLSRRQAAAYLDIDHSTISHAAGRDEDFARGLKRAEELSTAQPLMNLIAAGRKNWRAAAWFLNHKVKYPAALSEEEKDEQQQRKLADMRRTNEFNCAQELLREARNEEERARRQAREEKRKAEELARESAEREKLNHPRRWKKQMEAKGASGE